jgi:transcriptional regulator with XRE-family HTH domain
MNDVEGSGNDAEGPPDDAATPALRMFAAELRSWRLHLGWTQVELGDRIGYSDKLVSGVETCNRTPTLAFARACDKATGAPGTFARRHEDISRESFPPWFALVPILEAKARKIHTWDMRGIPGLLQTEAYARAIVRACRPDDTNDVIDRDVAARLERQDIFDREHPPFAWFAIAESVLRQIFGSKETLRDQLDKLIEWAERPGIVIQVVPASVQDCAGAGGPIVIFDIPDSPQVAYAEGYKVGRVIEAPDEVATMATVFDLLIAAALPRGESLQLIREIRSEYGE